MGEIVALRNLIVSLTAFQIWEIEAAKIYFLSKTRT
jgi:hypothetical protein